MSLYIKQDVRVFGMGPEIMLAVMVAMGVYQESGLDLTITAGIDGAHAAASSHYAGNAVDIRTSNVPADKLATILTTIQSRLTPDYFAQVETDHIHIQFKPQKTYTG